MNLTAVRSAETNKAGGGSTSTEPKGAPSSVSGHVTVMIPGELQQRIGVRTGRVERGPLVMSVDALGIVQPNETQVARVNIKTEGWIDTLFVNYVGQVVSFCCGKKNPPILRAQELTKRNASLSSGYSIPTYTEDKDASKTRIGFGVCQS
jgi:hypothetical protein